MAVTTQQIILEFDAETGQLTGKLKDVKKNVKEVDDSTAVLTNQLDKMTGGAISGFKNAAKGTKGFIKGLKATRGAIIATGIGALVIGLVSLVKVFTRSEEGARKFARAFESVKTVTNVIIDRLGMLGKAVSLLFERKFSEAAQVAKDAFTGINKEIQEEVALFDDLIQREQDLEDARIRQTVATAKTRAEIKELNLVAEDTTKSLEEREAAAARAGKLERALFEERRAQAQEELAIAKARLENTASTTEDRQRVAELEANIFSLAQESLELQTTLNNKLNTIRAEGVRLKEQEQELAKKEAEEAAKLAAEVLAAQRELEDELFALNGSAREREEMALQMLFDKRIAIAGDDEGLIKAATERFYADMAALDDKYRKEKDAADKAQSDKDLADDQKLLDTKRQMQADAFNALGQLSDAFAKSDEAGAKRSFKRNKALAFASAVVNTAQAVTDALAKDATFPGSRFIAAATAGAAGLAQVQNIAKTKFQLGSQNSSGGLGAGSLSAGYGATGGPGAPQVDFGFLGGGAGQDGPIQAYVIAQNVSNAQQANQQVQDQANLGG